MFVVSVDKAMGFNVGGFLKTSDAVFETLNAG